MKKITLLLIALFCISGHSQILTPFEGFESGTFPPNAPALWATFNNGVGTLNWTTNATSYQGSFAAYMNRQNIGMGNTSQNYLATPAVTVPANGQLKFFTRSFLAGDQGTKYKIMVKLASAGAQNNPTGYTQIQLWDENTLSTTYNVYEEKIVPLTAYVGQSVYVAFMMEFTQPTAALGGDRWLVDNVKIVSQCLDPTTQGTNPILATSATLTWANPGGATSFEIENMLSTATPTGVATGTSTTNSYVQTGLTALTGYKYYVRALCSNGEYSAWVGPFAYTTISAPLTCGSVFTDSGGSTANYQNNENTTTYVCADTSTNLVTVTFTAFNTQNCCDHLNVYDGSSASAPLLGTYQGTTLPPSLSSTVPGGCLTFVFTSDGSTTRAGWIANVTCAPAPTCTKPTAVAVTTLATTATLSWTQLANPDTSVANNWQVIAQPCGSPAPTATTTGWTAAPTNPFTLTGLTPATCYDFYVRAVCSATDSSNWSAFATGTTQTLPLACGGNYVDSGGISGNYQNNENNTVYVCADTPTNLVTVTFTSFATESCCDHLSVYDGSNASAPLLGTYQGTTLPPALTSSTPGGCLTFVFTSDSSVTDAGWVANITCAPAPTCSKPIGLTVTSSATTATLNWNQPQNPDSTTASSWEVIIQPAGSGVPSATATGIIVNSLPYTATGLTPGTNYEYYVRAVCTVTDSGPWGGPQTFYTAVSCGDSQPFCGATGQQYVNTTGAPSYGTINCLFTTPNPAWFYMQVAQSGPLVFTIHQGSNAPAYNNQDVDFVAWGPFTPAQYNTMCNNLYDYPSGNTTVPNNVAGCSYSAAATETFTIPNAVAGNYYIVLITNFSNQPGTVVFGQTNFGGSGAGSTDCNIVCSVDLGPPSIQLCDQTSYTITSSNQGATAYTWYNGASLITGQTGSTLTVTQSGTYTCTVTCGLNTSSDSINVTFNTSVTPTFTNIPTNICQFTAAPSLPTTSTNATPIMGTWSPSLIDTSIIGTTQYTFIPTGSQCATTTQVTITIDAPTIVPLFNTPAPICVGTPAPVLPTSDISGITGTWSPPVVSNTETNTYTFTPTLGQCATTAQVTVTVNSNCSFGSFANAVWLDNCSNSSTSNSNNFFNTEGSGTSIIGPVANVFNNTNFGVYTQNSGTFILRGAEVKTFKSSTANVCSARLHYRIYPQSGAPGAFTVLDLPFFDNCSGGAFPTGGPCNIGDQKWHNVLNNSQSPVDLTSYSPGNYVLEVYYDIDGSSSTTNLCNENILINNGGNNFIANYTIQSNPIYTSTNPTTCGGTDGTITISGLAPSTSYDLSYQNNTVPVGPITVSSDTNGVIVISGLGVGTYNNFSLLFNSCTSLNSNSIVLTNPLQPSITGTLSACVGQSTQLTGSTTAATTNAWTSSDTSVATVDTTGLVTGVSQGTATITYVNSNGCSITAIVTINALPSITGTLSACVGQSTQLTGSTTAATTNAWTSSDTSVATVDTTGLVTGVSQGTATITYVNSNGCSITAIVTINALPSITGTLSACVGQSTQLTGSTTAATTNAWTSSDTSVATVDTTGLVTGVSQGTATITYVNSNGCSITAIVTINALPSITGTLSACVGQSTQLTGSTTAATTNAWTSSDTSVATVDTTGLVTGVSQGTATITYVNSNGCSITAIVTINALPSITGTLSACVGQSTQLTGSTTAATTNAWTSSDTSVATVDTTGLVTGVSQGTAIITYVNSNGCSITAIVTINALPSITGTLSACVGQSTQLTGSTTAATTNAWTSSDTSVATVDTTGLVTGVSQGTATITYVNSNGCSITAIVTINSAFNFDLTGGCLDNNYQLEVSNLTNGVSIDTSAFVWYYNNDFTTSIATGGSTFNVTGYLNNTPANETSPFIFNVKVTSQDGCSLTKSFSVEKIYCDIQKGISPNGDGNNEYFDLSDLQVKQLEIFNRYGTKVYSKSGYTKEWVGQTDGGQELPDGTYYYVIEFSNGQDSKTGWIYINR